MSSSKLCRKKLIFSEEKETTHLPSCPPQSPSSVNSTPKSPPSCDPNPMLRIYLPRFAELFPTKPDVDNGQIDSVHPHEVNADETFTSPTSKSLVPTTSPALTQLTPTSQLQSPPHVNPASNILSVGLPTNSKSPDLCVTPKSNKCPILYFGSPTSMLHKPVFLTPSSFGTPTSNPLCPYCAIPDSISPDWKTYLKRSPVLETPPHPYCTTSEDEEGG